MSFTNGRTARALLILVAVKPPSAGRCRHPAIRHFSPRRKALVLPAGERVMVDADSIKYPAVSLMMPRPRDHRSRQTLVLRSVTRLEIASGSCAARIFGIQSSACRLHFVLCGDDSGRPCGSPSRDAHGLDCLMHHAFAKHSLSRPCGSPATLRRLDKIVIAAVALLRGMSCG